ncbi:5'(3')-deoxyribonucleotidase [Thermoflavifilum aggregans]|uniref:5'(3')-deoxyribonucleotidase n=1 Tax=Thermoflavifilum aggregans TaxID=454188 RepID=A0A2M9CWT0_9BACT|nr:5'(3')-deoxyribonucleotidase [Thermoflavifilum aggregans]PJJ76374.1 5'(3')-deoxyribonucleotidase [Thermoflavifilum aggregans]
MKKLTLIVDMDEVMADPITKLRTWYARDFNKKYTDAEIAGKHLADVVPPGHALILYQYLNTPGFFRDLAVMQDAVEVMKCLNEKYDLFVVSAAMEFPNSLKDKYEWLQEHFPFLQWQQICLCGSKHIISADIMIDDHSRNFHAGIKRKILFTSHHNIYEPAEERVNNWQEVAQLLLK